MRGNALTTRRKDLIFSTQISPPVALALSLLRFHHNLQPLIYRSVDNMSGLEPLAALGLACNVLQLVEVGHETIDLIKTVYRGGSPDATLDQHAAILKSISDEAKTCRRPTNCPKHEHQLFAAAERCSTAARDLREEIQFLVGNAKQGSLASTLKVVAKTNWRRRRIERLKESLDSTETLMQTGLLIRIW